MFQNAPAIAVGAFFVSPATHAAPATRQRTSGLRCAAAAPLARGATPSGFFPASFRHPSEFPQPLKIRPSPSVWWVTPPIYPLPCFLLKKNLEQRENIQDRGREGATGHTLKRLRESRELEGKRRGNEEGLEGPAAGLDQPTAYGLHRHGPPTACEAVVSLHWPLPAVYPRCARFIILDFRAKACYGKASMID